MYHTQSHKNSYTSRCLHQYSRFFFFNDTATTEIYTLSLHDALPISRQRLHHQDRHGERHRFGERQHTADEVDLPQRHPGDGRSEEHTSELQSPCNLVCRLLLEKKKKYETLACQHLYISHIYPYRCYS